MVERHHRTGLPLKGCPASNAIKGNHERDAYGHCHLCGSGPAVRATPPSPSTAPTSAPMNAQEAIDLLRDALEHYNQLAPNTVTAREALRLTANVESNTAPTVEVDERTAFEAYMTDHGMICQRVGESYHSNEAHNMWMAWRASARRAALASKPPAREAAERQSIDTPAGFKLVPLKPTPEMIEAFWNELEGACGSYFEWERGGDEGYTAMLNAAPAAGNTEKPKEDP